MTMHQVSDVICHVLDVLDESGEGKVVAGDPFDVFVLVLPCRLS